MSMFSPAASWRKRPAARSSARALSLVSVGQEQDEDRTSAPLILPEDDELVDDGLGNVGEIPVLRLPKPNLGHAA